MITASEIDTDTETFAPFDPAHYLNTVDDVATYLEAIIEESGDDPAAIARALGAVARSRNFSQIARQAGMSREGLYKALSADGNPQPLHRDQGFPHTGPAPALRSHRLNQIASFSGD